MTPLEWVAVLLALVVAVRVGPHAIEWLFRTDGERPVMPAHYSSLLETDPTSYPGHCANCGTDNEPGYRFCEACGSEIPSSDRSRSDEELREILGE